MPRKLPLYVVKQKTRHGRVVFYFRIGKGPRTRLPDLNDPTFRKAYEACLKGEPLPKPGRADPRSIRWLIDRYKESGDWMKLSEATHRQRTNIFKHISEKAGDMPFSMITKRAVENGMEDRSATPAQAGNYLKAMVGLCKWAVRNGHMDENPCIGVEKIRFRSDGFPAWTVDDVARFCSRWPIGTKQRLALELALHTGLRRSDLCRVGRQHLNGNTLTMRTKKTGAQITVELPQRVIDLIAATPSKGLFFLSTEYGTPFSVPGFGNWFGDAAREAGLEKNTHGLRKLAATLAANGGATAHELMSQFGWTSSKQAEIYTKGADRARLGVKSSRIVSEQLGNVLAPHPTSSEGFSAKSAKISKS
ncbi:tyrosine-type recombinase/integrase [Martelella mediterranea]|uniref:Site-specific recombinase XerD n=1 Tax=Martelella mediterranea TaxID=293089 RepID=A0A4R3NVR1_9HYPH|nr:tyrosine-type recombinase/integrase [Martelella mediterranea]TCT42750.1 site-specific recombinase XerD [Martelella mediterranea]